MGEAVGARDPGFGTRDSGLGSRLQALSPLASPLIDRAPLPALLFPTRMLTELVCIVCGRSYPPGDHQTCRVCGPEGILDARYDYDAVEARPDARGAARRRSRDMWRYRELLPGAGRRPAARRSRSAGRRSYEAPRLAAAVGVRRLFLKDEGRNPTSSFKDRASCVGVAKALEFGYAGHRVRLDGQRRLVAGRDGRLRRPPRVHLRARARARTEDRAAADVRRHGLPRARHLRAGVRSLPRGVRAVPLVQPQQRHESVSGRRQEDGRPRDRRAVLDAARCSTARCPTGWRCRSATAAPSAASRRACTSSSGWASRASCRGCSACRRRAPARSCSAFEAKADVVPVRRRHGGRQHRRRHAAQLAARPRVGARVAGRDDRGPRRRRSSTRCARRRGWAAVFGEPAGVAGVAGLRAAVAAGLVPRRRDACWPSSPATGSRTSGPRWRPPASRTTSARTSTPSRRIVER